LILLKGVGPMVVLEIAMHLGYSIIIAALAAMYVLLGVTLMYHNLIALLVSYLS
jgi:hypothetical protein